MPRLKPLPPATTPELKPHFDFFLGTLGFTPNSVLTMQRKPKLVQAPAGAFVPAPKVDSAVIRMELTPTARFDVPDEEHHRAVVGTVVVAKDGRDLVIVTEAVKPGRALDEVLGGGRGLPPIDASAVSGGNGPLLADLRACQALHQARHAIAAVRRADRYTSSA